MGAPQKRKRNTDPNKPKRPTSGYFYFAAEQRTILKSKGGAITKVTEWTKEVSAKWRTLDASQKVKFDKLAMADKQRYDAEMIAYKGIDPNKPKKPQSSYFLWLGDFRKANKDAYSEHKELLRAAGEEWKGLSAAQKKPYETKALAEKAKHEIAMQEYNRTGGASAPKQPKPAPAAAAAAAASNDVEDEEEEEEYDEEEDEAEE